MQKLTLSVDRDVIEGAKRYARARGTSVSRLVENMLHLVSTGGSSEILMHASGESDHGSAAPVLARLRGSLAHADVAEHKQHLTRKYR